MISYDVNGISLADASGRWWVTAEGSSHSPALQVRSIDNTVPGRAGILPAPIGERRESATMNLRVMVSSRTATVRENRWEAVKSLFTGGREFTLGRTISGVRRSAVAKLRSISEPDLTAGAGALVGVISVTLLDGAFHSDPVEQTFTLTSAGAIVDLTAAGTAPVDDWWIRVNGPATSVLVRSVVRGQIDSTRSSAWAGTKSSTDRLFLRANTAWTSSSDSWTEPSSANQIAGASSGSAGALEIVPSAVSSDPMTRRSQIHIQASGVDSTTKLTVRAGATWA